MKNLSLTLFVMLLIQSCIGVRQDDSIDLGNNYRFIQDTPQTIIYHSGDKYKGTGEEVIPLNLSLPALRSVLCEVCNPALRSVLPLKGEGLSVNYKYRMHDPRIGRFFAVDPTGGMMGKTIKHTFSKHGSHNTMQLLAEAKNSKKAVGQWLDDSAAEKFISENLYQLKDGTRIIEIPEGLGRVINPDGSFSVATHAKLVPSGSDVITAIPGTIENLTY